MGIPDSHIALLIDQTSSESLTHARGGTSWGRKMARHSAEGLQTSSKQPSQPVGILSHLRSREGRVKGPSRLSEDRPNIASGSGRGGAWSSERGSLVDAGLKVWVKGAGPHDCHMHVKDAVLRNRPRHRFLDTVIVPLS